MGPVLYGRIHRDDRDFGDRSDAVFRRLGTIRVRVAEFLGPDWSCSGWNRHLYSESDAGDLRCHVVPLDIPALPVRSIDGPGMEVADTGGTRKYRGYRCLVCP